MNDKLAKRALPVPAKQRDLIKAIGMDIGKETVAYLDVMYPEAAKACSSTFRLSLRNHICNEFMAALDVNEAGAAILRIAERRVWRRKWLAAWKKIRAQGKDGH